MEGMNIFQKMSAITNELGIVAKNLNVDMGKGKSYKAVQEKDILDAVKPLEAKYGVYSFPVNREIVESNILERENQYGTTKNLFMRIQTTYKFVNVEDKNDYITMITFADGIDTGDKATGKAMTYADKYALMKAYKITTGDDPDAEASPEKGYKPEKEKITSSIEKSLRELILNNGISNEEVIKTLKELNHNKLSDLYLEEVNEFKEKLNL